MYIKKSFNEMEYDSLIRSETQDFTSEQLDDSSIIVYNMEKQTQYLVTIDENYVVDCECAHRKFRGCRCKHMYFVSKEYNLAV